MICTVAWTAASGWALARVPARAHTPARGGVRLAAPAGGRTWWALLGAVLLPALVLAAPARGAAQTAALVPHRATYVLSRHATSDEPAITSVGGQLEIRFEQSCDGWRVEQAIAFRLFNQSGQSFDHAAHVSAWEPAADRAFWFNTLAYENGRRVEEINGVARLRQSGDGGTVRSSRPAPGSRELPAGTLFIVGQIDDLIRAARGGARHLSRVVFDGSTADGPYDVSAFIGRESEAPAGTPASLGGHRAWPVRLAYFKTGAREPTAEFEMSALLFDNGVGTDMVYDYGKLAIGVKLDELEMLTIPEC